MLESQAWGGHLIQNWRMHSNTCALLAGTPTKWRVLWQVKKLLCFLSVQDKNAKTAMDLWPNHKVAWCWDRCYSSEKKRPTRGIAIHTLSWERERFSSARGSQGTPLTRVDISVLIQEVLQSLTKRSSLRHNQHSSMENTSDQPTPVSDTAPFNPLRKQYSDYRWHSWRVQQVLRALTEDHHTSPHRRPPYPREYPAATRPVPMTSELVITYIVGLISNYSVMYIY